MTAPRDFMGEVRREREAEHMLAHEFHGDVRDMGLALLALRARLAAAEREEESSHVLISRQSALLTGVVNAICGTPEPLSHHSVHDVVELVQELVRERDEAGVQWSAVQAMTDEIVSLRERLAAAEEAHAAMRDECSALRFDLRAALGALRRVMEPTDEELIAAAKREPDFDERYHSIIDRDLLAQYMYMARARDAAQATGREG